MIEEEVIAQGIQFLLAGYATTHNTLTFIFYLLALHPEWQERLQEEIESVIGDQVYQFCRV